MSDKIIMITCEHAGNEVPEDYKDLFTGSDGLLSSHRGWDPGAFELAEFLGKNLNAPLFFTKTSRLLIEANRSLSAPDLFSEFSAGLPEEKKMELVEKIYNPYRQNVEAFAEEKINEGKTVFHISIHTFTPVLAGVTRRGDVGLLFDPARKNELKFCKLLERELINADYRLLVKHNFPYKGTDDGFTTFLRNKFPAEKYLGIELEINQKFPVLNPERWNLLRENISTALNFAALKF